MDKYGVKPILTLTAYCIPYALPCYVWYASVPLHGTFEQWNPADATLRQLFIDNPIRAILIEHSYDKY